MLIALPQAAAAPAPLGALARAAASVLDTSRPGIFWPIVGIAAIFVVALVISRFVRGDPYYERNASRDRRDTSPVPWGNDGSGDSDHFF